ncbi:MAG: glycine cleavage system aminomethyltransferase GcvT [Planctomycetota bacterium]|nr:glycine cleavage system aminomethyltransferase GcvT [Planctomycetota bacterium]
MSNTTTESTSLKRTAFHQFHLDRGAKMVDFAGWEMPLHYGSIIEEHRQVRTSGGIFDVSHMGRFTFTGRDARAFLDRVCTRQIWGMKDGQARYSIVCNERGGARDDVLVYRIAEGDYIMVCNAANREKLVRHFEEVRGDLVFKFEDITLNSAMIAVQGPRVFEVIGKYDNQLPELKRFRFAQINVLGLKVMIARTGYTGEDGVEIIFRTDNMVSRMAIKTLMKDLTAVDDVLKPAGLGARDSLRLEAAMALYGHEITEELDPVSAGLMFAIKLDKSEDPEKSPPEVGRFIGQDALQKIAQNPQRKLVGLHLDSKRAARQDMKILADGSEIGFVTSGCLSPTLEKSIAMAYVQADHAEEGRTVQVDLGRQAVDAQIIPLPFYKRG